MSKQGERGLYFEYSNLYQFKHFKKNEDIRNE
jgi:hypothetical protein